MSHPVRKFKERDAQIVTASGINSPKPVAVFNIGANPVAVANQGNLTSLVTMYNQGATPSMTMANQSEVTPSMAMTNPGEVTMQSSGVESKSGLSLIMAEYDDFIPIEGERSSENDKNLDLGKLSYTDFITSNVKIAEPSKGNKPTDGEDYYTKYMYSGDYFRPDPSNSGNRSRINVSEGARKRRESPDRNRRKTESRSRYSPNRGEYSRRKSRDRRKEDRRESGWERYDEIKWRDRERRKQDEERKERERKRRDREKRSEMKSRDEEGREKGRKNDEKKDNELGNIDEGLKEIQRRKLEELRKETKMRQNPVRRNSYTSNQNIEERGDNFAQRFDREAYFDGQGIRGIPLIQSIPSSNVTEQDYGGHPLIQSIPLNKVTGQDYSGHPLIQSIPLNRVTGQDFDGHPQTDLDIDDDIGQYAVGGCLPVRIENLNGKNIVKCQQGNLQFSYPMDGSTTNSPFSNTDSKIRSSRTMSDPRFQNFDGDGRNFRTMYDPGFDDGMGNFNARRTGYVEPNRQWDQGTVVNYDEGYRQFGHGNMFGPGFGADDNEGFYDGDDFCDGDEEEYFDGDEEEYFDEEGDDDWEDGGYGGEDGGYVGEGSGYRGDVTGLIPKCNICFKLFQSKNMLEDHLRDFHNIGSGSRHMAGAELRGNQMTRGQLRHTVKCLGCGKVFQSRKTIERHLIQDHGGLVNGRYSCLICSGEFQTSGELKYHLANYHVEVLSKNVVVQKKKKMSAAAARGANLMAANVDISNVVFIETCLVCQVKLFNTKNAKNHFQAKHAQVGNGWFKCKVCNKTFQQNSVFQKHISDYHTYPVPQDKQGTILKVGIKCKICGLNCRRLRLLKRHLQRDHIHTRQKCPMCNFTTILDRSLHKHIMKAHTVEKPFKCLTCHTSFDLQEELDHHRVAHQIRQETIVDCEFCGESIKGKTQWFKHMRKVHQQTSMRNLKGFALFML